MKKLLISLTILFSLFLGINSVNAKTETATYTFTSDKNAIINTYNMTQEEIESYTATYKVATDKITSRIAKEFIQLREYYETNYKNEYDYYIIVDDLNYSGGYFKLFVFNEDSINQKIGEMLNSRSYYNILAISFFELSANSYKYFYLDNNSKFNISSSTSNYYVSSGGKTNTFDINYQSTYYETNYNIDIKLSSTGSNNLVYDSFTYDSKVYYSNDFLFNTMTSNELNRLKEDKPKINISLIDKQEEFEKINVNFSAFNTDKYIYYYSIDRENWIDILENDYKYTSYINGTLYVMILDKQEFIESAESGNIVYNPLATATYTFSDISEIIPELKFKLNISDSCKIRKNTEEIIVCKNLDIEIINYNSIDKYMWQYSFERENFGNIYTNKFNIEFSENKTIYFKLLDKINNEELKYVTYTITGISTVPGDIGAYIKMNGSYNKDSFSYEIDTYFYNYDSSLYNYYYSEDGINWNEISSYNMLATTNSSIKHIILKFYKDLTVYVKIENKNNEYVNAATYTITYFSNNDSLKDSLDLFSSKSYLTGQAFKNFSEIWNKFKRETGIYTYLLMVVLSSIALLLIKSFRK